MYLENKWEENIMRGRRNILKLFSCYFLFGTPPVYAGVSEWSKEAGLGPAAIGLRGFESHPPHHHIFKLFML